MQLSTEWESLASGLVGRLWVWLSLTLLSVAAFGAQPPAPGGGTPVGEVIFVQGVATAQLPGGTPRFLQKGEPLHDTETVTTGGQGFAVISFKDGTKFTLRPNTTFAIERYSHGPTDSAAFRLLKGGMRAVTGAISKKDPRAMEVKTTTATIGIRGTSFDARLCGTECAEEEKKAGRKVPAAQPDLVVARVVLLTGSAQAIGGANQTRALSQGAALFSGDTVRTEKASNVVLAFRDQSKVTVIADSEFKLEDVRFSGPRSESGSFTVRIVKGGVRALTGLLGKSNPKAVKFGITTAVIGLRGSGFDGWIGQLCAPGGACVDAALLNTWLDGTELEAGGQVQSVNEGQTAGFTPGPGQLTLLVPPPPFIDPKAPRPDGINVNFEELFAALPQDTPGPGLHLGMRGDGETVLIGSDGSLNLAGDEAGWLPEGQGRPLRISPNWATIMNQLFPAPESFDERSTRLLQLLNPGDVICEIR